MSNDTATALPTLAIAVRGLRGRKWFDACCGWTADRDFMETLVEDLRKDHPELRFEVMPKDEVGPTAPEKYRPWVKAYGSERDDEVNVDELTDDEL